MPYNSVDELPDAVKKLPPKQQRQWMSVFNSAYNRCIKSGKNPKTCEEFAFKNAWGVIKKTTQGNVEGTISVISETRELGVDNMDSKECSPCKEELTDIEEFSEENLRANASEEGEEAGYYPEEEAELNELAWDTKFINSLPNAAFAVVEPCWKEKKTARHLPHHSASVKSASENSSVDKPHLKNALARVNQVKGVCNGSDSAIRSRAKAHLVRHARAILPSSRVSQIAAGRKHLLDDEDDISALISILDELIALDEKTKEIKATFHGWKINF